MEFFRSFLRVLGLLDDAKVDFISDLPPEVSHLILRKLDPKSLLCAARVSRKWLSVCRADKSLRQTAMHHKQRAMRILKERFAGEAVGDPTTILHRHLPTPALVRRCVPFVPTKHGVARKIPRNAMHSLGKGAVLAANNYKKVTSQARLQLQIKNIMGVTKVVLNPTRILESLDRNG